MPCLRSPLAFASSLVLAALSLACEVRVETPPEPDDPGYDRYDAPPLSRYEDIDEPPPALAWDPPGSTRAISRALARCPALIAALRVASALPRSSPRRRC